MVKTDPNGERLWPRIVQWLITLALPIALVVANIHIATGHWFVRWEYGKSGFAPDTYGLTTAERTHLADVCIDFLATSADISLLEDLRVPDGEPAFNGRELRHMIDVQVVYDRLTVAGILAAAIVVGGTAVLLRTGHSRQRVPRALLKSGLLTLGLLACVGGYMVLGWNSFFTTFHRIFFEGETWIFDFSDTLIRLFPIRFWMDVALVIVGLLVVEAIVVTIVGWIWKPRALR